jgi:pilus assembly protein Flp/PilA
MRQLLKRFWSDESGQGMVEYALIVALVAIGLIAVFLYLRNSAGQVLDTAADSLKAQPTSGFVPTP